MVQTSRCVVRHQGTYLTSDIQLVGERGRQIFVLLVTRTHNTFDDRKCSVAGPDLCNSWTASTSNFLVQGFQKLDRTDRQTDASERITTPHSPLLLFVTTSIPRLSIYRDGTTVMATTQSGREISEPCGLERAPCVVLTTTWRLRPITFLFSDDR